MKDMLEDGGYPDYSFATVARFVPNESYNGLTITEINKLREGSADIDGEITTILDMMGLPGKFRSEGDGGGAHHADAALNIGFKRLIRRASRRPGRRKPLSTHRAITSANAALTVSARCNR